MVFKYLKVLPEGVILKGYLKEFKMLAMNKKMFSVVSILLLLVLVGFFTIRQLNLNQELLKPKRGDVVESIYGLGTVSADSSFNVRVGVAITVNKLFVKEGDIVNRGSRLVKIDDSVMNSPIDGTITKVSYKEGELAAPQASILTVTNLKRLYLEVSLEQQSVLRIKEGQEVFVSFETIRNEKYTGRVRTVYPRENQFIVRIELEQWPVGVLPGMTADAAIIVGKKINVLLIPLTTIVAGQVTRIRKLQKEKVFVKLGVLNGEWAEVLSENIQENDELLNWKK